MANPEAPNLLTFPIPGLNTPPGPTWIIINYDNPLSFPVMGQFDPGVRMSDGSPIWESKPGLGGGLAWLKFVGRDIGTLKFSFYALAVSVFDTYPLVAWKRINELATIDPTLGRPPRVLFTHGLILAEGFITEIPEAPMVYWGTDNSFGGFFRSRMVREVGPVDITITRIPKEPAEISLSTGFITRTEETRFEEVSLKQYGDARYSQALELHNLGVKVEEKLEIPRKDRPEISRPVPLAPFLDEIDPRV